MNNLSISVILLLFLIAAATTCFAGVTLVKTTNTLDTRFKLGEDIGGLILLGVACSLPEIAVVVSAAVNGHIPIITGIILGGIIIRTLSIVFLDFAVNKKRPLSYLAGSPILFIEILFAITLAIIGISATFIPQSNNLFGTNPLSIVLVIGYVAGLFVINKIRKNPILNKTSEDAMPGRRHHERRAVENHRFYANKSNVHVVIIFILACVVTLIAGVILEISGAKIAAHLGVGTGIFAATAIALVTALPEISTGIESVLIGDNHLAVSDIIGGNTFILTIFFAADLFAGKPVLSLASRSDVFLAGLGIIMMAVYAISFIFKPRRRYLRLGFDSILEIAVYGVGMYWFTLIK